MFDNYDILYNTFVFNGQIQVYADPGSFRRTDQGIIAHCACKGNAIPMTEHPIAYVVLGLVSCAFKVFSLVAHYCCCTQNKCASNPRCFSSLARSRHSWYVLTSANRVNFVSAGVVSIISAIINAHILLVHHQCVEVTRHHNGLYLTILDTFTNIQHGLCLHKRNTCT